VPQHTYTYPSVLAFKPEIKSILKQMPGIDAGPLRDFLPLNYPE
jgi:hypothetical protein